MIFMTRSIKIDDHPMDMKLQAVIWDIDGTLLDTSEGVIDTYKYCIKNLGLKEMSDEELERLNGPVSQVVFSKYFHLKGDDIQNATNFYREYYVKYNLYKAKPYEGAIELMDAIQQRSLLQAIATNKRQDIAEAVCEYFGFSQYMSCIIGQNDSVIKPKSDMIKECMERLHAYEAVMIGDTEGDKQAAEESGVNFIGVNYGYGFSHVKEYANSLKEVLELVNSGESL